MSARTLRDHPADGARPTAAPAIPDLRRLHAFVVVAEELHFRRAATRLVMAQSPLSRVIKKLEHDVGVQLFVRNRHSVRLTPAGAALLDDARELLRQANSAVERARSHAPPSAFESGGSHQPPATWLKA